MQTRQIRRTAIKQPLIFLDELEEIEKLMLKTEGQKHLDYSVTAAQHSDVSYIYKAKKVSELSNTKGISFLNMKVTFRDKDGVESSIEIEFYPFHSSLTTINENTWISGMKAQILECLKPTERTIPNFIYEQYQNITFSIFFLVTVWITAILYSTLKYAEKLGPNASSELISSALANPFVVVVKEPVMLGATILLYLLLSTYIFIKTTKPWKTSIILSKRSEKNKVAQRRKKQFIDSFIKALPAFLLGILATLIAFALNHYF